MKASAPPIAISRSGARRLTPGPRARSGLIAFVTLCSISPSGSRSAPGGPGRWRPRLDRRATPPRSSPGSASGSRSGAATSAIAAFISATGCAFAPSGSATRSSSSPAPFPARGTYAAPRRISSALKDLQDALGGLNDLETRHGLMNGGAGGEPAPRKSRHSRSRQGGRRARASARSRRAGLCALRSSQGLLEGLRPEALFDDMVLADRLDRARLQPCHPFFFGHDEAHLVSDLERIEIGPDHAVPVEVDLVALAVVMKP